MAFFKNDIESANIKNENPEANPEKEGLHNSFEKNNVLTQDKFEEIYSRIFDDKEIIVIDDIEDEKTESVESGNSLLEHKPMDSEEIYSRIFDDEEVIVIDDIEDEKTESSESEDCSAEYKPLNPEEIYSMIFDDEEISDELDTDDSEECEEQSEKQDKHIVRMDGHTYYYDDNGNLFRKDGDLLPNKEYEINGYKYKTDEYGRIISAEGKLHLKNREGRKTINDSMDDIGKGDQKEGDERGHLIGDQFDGSNGLENLIPQDAKINHKEYKELEKQLADSVKNNKEVYVKVEPVYEGDSRRPTNIVVTYTIDGETKTVIFPNGEE